MGSHSAGMGCPASSIWYKHLKEIYKGENQTRRTLKVGGPLQGEAVDGEDLLSGQPNSDSVGCRCVRLGRAQRQIVRSSTQHPPLHGRKCSKDSPRKEGEYGGARVCWHLKSLLGDPGWL